MDLLLDVDIAVDLCARRDPYCEAADRATAKCLRHGGRLWLYCGSADALEHATREALRSGHAYAGSAVSDDPLAEETRDRLAHFCADKHWLSALAAEGPLFAGEDPQGERLVRAMDRFGEGTIALLTRNRHRLRAYPDRCITPEDYCSSEGSDRRLDLVDLRTQQDAIRPRLEQDLHRVLHHGRYILGDEVRRLECELADYVGVGHGIGVSSGTDALLVALLALEVGPGDEVITSAFSFFATAEMIVLIGARPVFVDIDPRTYNIDAGRIESAITSKTRAIIPVSLYGQCPDMDAIAAVAARHGLPVIEDAAQSFGATYKGRRSGGLTTVGCTSFFPSKPLGCYGDGGACFTDDDDLARRMRQIADHGQDGRYHHVRIGINGRLDTLQAAVLRAKLALFPREVEARARIGGRYTERLADSVGTPCIEPHNTSVYAQYTIQVADRDGLAARLAASGVPTAVHYPLPLTRQPCLARFAVGVPRAEAAAERVLSLPMSAWLTEGQQDRVLAAVEVALRDQGPTIGFAGSR